MSAEEKIKLALSAARKQRLFVSGSYISSDANKTLQIFPDVPNNLSACKPWPLPDNLNKKAGTKYDEILRRLETSFGLVENQTKERLKQKLEKVKIKDPFLFARNLEAVINSLPIDKRLGLFKVDERVTKNESFLNHYNEELLKPYLLSKTFVERQVTKVEYEEVNDNLRIEVDLGTLKHNAQELSAGGSVLFANFTTFGMLPQQYIACAETLARQGATLIVSDLNVIGELKANIKGVRVIFSPTSTIDIEGGIHEQVPIVLKSMKDIQAAGVLSREVGKRAEAHIQVDVGNGGLRLDDVRQAIQLLKSYDISVVGCFGIPLDGTDGEDQFLDVYNQINNEFKDVTPYFANKGLQSKRKIVNLLCNRDLWGLSATPGVKISTVTPVLTVRSKLISEFRQLPTSKTKNPPPGCPVVCGGFRDGLEQGMKQVLVLGEKFQCHVEGKESYIISRTFNEYFGKATATGSYSLPAIWHGRSGNYVVHCSQKELMQIPAHIPRSLYDSSTDTAKQLVETKARLERDRDTILEQAVTQLVEAESSGKSFNELTVRDRIDPNDSEKFSDELDSQPVFGFGGYTRPLRLRIPKTFYLS